MTCHELPQRNKPNGGGIYIYPKNHLRIKVIYHLFVTLHRSPDLSVCVGGGGEGGGGVRSQLVALGTNPPR